MRQKPLNEIPKVQSIMTSLGFTEKEALVYIGLLKFGEAGPAAISEKAGLKRPTVYLILDSLEKRGAVARFQFGKRELFRAVNPQVLLSLFDKACANLKDMFISLAEGGELPNNLLETQVYSGPEGISRMWADTLTCKTVIRHMSEPGYSRGVTQPDFGEDYRKSRVGAGIPVKILVPFFKSSKRLKALGLADYQKLYLRLKATDSVEKREIRFLPEEQFRLEAEITIYDDKVQMLSYYEQVGIVIKSRFLAASHAIIFDNLFRYAGLLEKDLVS